jgi:predicted phosphodiesterase
LQKATDEEFIRAWNEFDTVDEVAKALGITTRAAFRRRGIVEKKLSIVLKASHNRGSFINYKDHLSRATMSMDNGVIFVASDAHYLPGEPSAAHRAFVKLIRKHKPEVIIMNGDVFDGITISRYPKAYYENAKPNVKQELEAVSDRLGEIEKVRGNARLFWTLGNHDARYEARLANLVPEYQGVAGFSLKEHFPAWLHCMSLMINNNLMVKHRFRNGVHAAWNNTLHSGVSIVTGHLHRLQAIILGDYRGNRWGIDTGTLADLDGEHMGYGEDNPMNHASGFAVLTIVDGELIYPEFCFVRDDVAYFRGKAV